MAPEATLTIAPPAGDVSAISITEVFWFGPNRLFLRDLDKCGLGPVRGEAVMAEVTPGHWLFALLRDQEGILFYQLRTDGGVAETLPDILAQRTPLVLPEKAWPMLVTFDDIARPETVRLVDPDDLDATFGCERENAASRFPWRDEGFAYRDWAEREVLRLSREMAAGRSGLTGPAGDAIAETAFIADQNLFTEADEMRLDELRPRFTEEQQRKWQKARVALAHELPGTLPTPQTMTAGSGGQCYQMKAVTMEVTDEPVTEGRVERVLGWLNWRDEEWREYACKTFGCNDNPIRLNEPAGHYQSLALKGLVADLSLENRVLKKNMSGP